VDDDDRALVGVFEREATARVLDQPAREPEAEAAPVFCG